MSKNKDMKQTVITMEYDQNFERDILQIKTELINFLQDNLKNPKTPDHKQLTSLTRSYILDKVKKDFKKNELIKPQEFTLFCVRIIDFCLDYGFMILDTIAKLEQFQLEQYQNVKVFTAKTNDKQADA